MCHMVSWFKPPSSAAEMNLMQTEVFNSEESARVEAELKLKSGCSEVRVWQLVGTPVLVPTVEWK